MVDSLGNYRPNIWSKSSLTASHVDLMIKYVGFSNLDNAANYVARQYRTKRYSVDSNLRFRGVFVGIDRYKHVRWLSCARRDALGLHAAFTDNFGDGADLLVDGQATRANITAAFERLFSCDKNDLVVIAFSGHGSESHQLVTFDADPNDLENTGISLALLVEWF